MTNRVIRKVERKRCYRPFDAKSPRERSVCPRCGSLDVRKRRSTFDYICGRCEWIGQSVERLMV